MQFAVVWDVEIYNPYRQREFIELSMYRPICCLHVWVIYHISASREQKLTYISVTLQRSELYIIILWFEAVSLQAVRHFVLSDAVISAVFSDNKAFDVTSHFLSSLQLVNDLEAINVYFMLSRFKVRRWLVGYFETVTLLINRVELSVLRLFSLNIFLAVLYVILNGSGVRLCGHETQLILQ